jgi:hypothetical protein
VARDETGAPLESLEAAGAALRALAASLGGGGTEGRLGCWLWSAVRLG